MSAFNTPSVEGVWTPTLTFTTPGNLAVTYVAQIGKYLVRDGWAELYWAITTSAFTHSTASGQMQVGGVPFVAAGSQRKFGSGLLAGYTKAGTTQTVPYILAGQQFIPYHGTGSGVGNADITAADMPSGGAPVLYGTLKYPVV